MAREFKRVEICTLSFLWSDKMFWKRGSHAAHYLFMSPTTLHQWKRKFLVFQNGSEVDEKMQ